MSDSSSKNTGSLALRLAELEKTHGRELYTVRCDIGLQGDGTARLTFREDAYAIVNASLIDEDLIFPLRRGEDPSGRNSKYAVKLEAGTIVELHVKTLAHSFEVGDFSQPFYIDEDSLSVVYLDQKPSEKCEYNCRKWVVVVDIYCCSGGFLKGGFGSVGCGNDWCDDRCCD